MTCLVKFAQHTWIVPSDVLSIVAFDAESYKDQELAKPRVVLTTSNDKLQWSFETMQQADAFADKLAAIVNAHEPNQPQEPPA